MRRQGKSAAGAAAPAGT